MFVVVGARDFSPEITAHIIGTEVPCFKNDKFQLSVFARVIRKSKKVKKQKICHILHFWG